MSWRPLISKRPNALPCVAPIRGYYGTLQTPAVESKHFAKLRGLVFHVRPARRGKTAP